MSKARALFVVFLAAIGGADAAAVCDAVHANHAGDAVFWCCSAIIQLWFALQAAIQPSPEAPHG